MRNWNPHWSPRNNISSRFQTTYEELKHPVLFRKRRGAGFQTTYEELKLLVAVGGFGDGASRLPMRNWNKPGKPSPQAGCCCFQTTYEELKRAWMILSSLQASCFQTTYEELKHISNSGPYQRNGFQTTYEELKRSIKTTRPPNPAGFQTTYEELKPSLFSTTLRKRALPDYLWGIETVVSDEYSCQRRCQASRLPMRNWNYTYLGKPVQKQRFQTTYEELKQANHLEATLKIMALPDYLWGIETYIQLRPIPTKWLPDYLWGIETEIRDLSAILVLCFQTTYEELKLRICRQTRTARRAASRLPMRNWNSSSRLILAQSSASRLPMRNWNDKISFVSRLGTLLPDYLWGIETYVAFLWV